MKDVITGPNIFAFLLMLPAFIASADEPAGVADAPEELPSPAQIQVWVNDLKSDQFQDREAATSKLISTGYGAVAPIVKALKRNDLEVTTRGIHVLQQLAQRGDLETANAARTALEQIAALRVTSAARHAIEALDKLAVLRHEQTIEELKRLGAVVSNYSDPATSGLPGAVKAQHVIEIGEGWHGKPEDLKRLSWLQDVTEVILDGKQVNDQWLQNLPAASSLTSLSIKRASITDDSLKHLSSQKELKLLSLMYVPVGDKSIPHLRRLHKLTAIRLYGLQFSPEGLTELRTSLPQTHVDVRRGAFLGIGCQPGQIGCMIVTVTAGSSAEKADFRVNDTILKYEGKPVPDFETLTAMIAGHEPGDTVTMEIQRGARQLTKTVTFGAWK